ncbi:Clp protease N-terminal domain-containing protein [Streptomyces zingiberis]|uniref:Clp protease N-terminal domain-containing protein n=1 Tax=Streptomyces zingiberis TaxID=2053010 RepID=UPI002892B84A|nr:Clp protease N-terminal domain-containing protein [Streptomyces zingiberis]
MPVQPLRPARPSGGGPLPEAPAAVVSGARRLALRAGDRQTDTAHLLHSLLDSDPETRALFDDRPARLLRLRGYLAQRSIGYGLRWHGSAEGAGADRRPVRGGTAPLSPAAVTALAGAAARARARGAEAAVSGPDLLASLAAEPDCRAAEVLRRTGVDAARLLARPEPRPVDAGS